MKVKIYGAGSIGNHLAQASRRAGWEVVVVDPNPEALRRMKEEIYPARYGAWDPAIELFLSEDQPRGGFDAIMIGTPPDVRMKVALEALREKPRLIQLEKPLSEPLVSWEAKSALRLFADECSRAGIAAVVGYEYVLGEGTRLILELLDKAKFTEVELLEVSFRENWKGIFAAHPWLKGPEETYLGYWKRGGGASGEHSHAIHFWQHFASFLGLGRISEVSAAMKIVKSAGAEYDSLCSISAVTEKGFLARIAQDVITEPPLMSLRIQGMGARGRSFIEWYRYSIPGEGIFEEVKWLGGSKRIPIKRPDDFYHEILHIGDIVNGEVRAESSPIALPTGIQALLVVTAAHASRLMGSIVTPIGYDY